jgi:3-dehydroquinate dehydratase II
MNLLGEREPEIYGFETYDELMNSLIEFGNTLGVSISYFQSNCEGEIVDKLQKIRFETDGVLLNAAAYTHTSVAIHDTIKVVQYPVVEIHMSDPQNREKFRHFSFIESVAIKTFKGEGADSYKNGLEYLSKYINR